MKTWNPKRLPGVAMAAVALSALSALFALPAQADVISFEAAATAGLYLPGESFSEGGFVLTTLIDVGIVDTAAALGTQATTGNATQFYFASNDGGLRVASTTGIGLNLSGFSAAFVAQDPASLQSTVLVARGTLQNNSTVTASFAFGTSSTTNFPFVSYGGASLAAFTNLQRVEFFACSWVGGVACSVPTANNGQFAIDNISVSVVPEPGAALLLALGLAGVGLRNRRTVVSTAR